MWLHYADDVRASSRGDQYLWGRDILVAPVVEKGATIRQVYLPRGSWFDFWTNERLTGLQQIIREIDLETMPIFVRAGAVIPLAPVRQYVDEPTTEPTALIVYPGADGMASIYEDDGRTLDYRKDGGMRITLRWRDAQRTLTLGLAPGSRMRSPATRVFDVRIAGAASGRTVTFDGRSIDVKL